MHMDDTTSARLATTIHITHLVVLGFASILVVLAITMHIPLIAVCAVITCGFWLSLRIARYQLINHGRTPAAYWVGGSALASALLLTCAIPQLATNNAVVALLVGIAMLQFAPHQHSRYYLGVCGLASALTVLIGQIMPHPALHATFLAWLNISLLLTDTGVALLMLWQFSSRLQETLAHVQDTNNILANLNNRLQRELHEHQRTETALQASERRMRALLNAIPDHLYRIQGDGQIIDAKNSECNPVKQQQAAAVTQHMLPSAATIQQAIQTREVQQYEGHLVIDGLVCDYEGRVTVVADDEVVVIIRNVTDLKQVDRLKREFIATVSHELRTPLTAIRGSLGLILGGVIGECSPTILSMLDIAGRNCERLLRLVNDILDIEQISTGNLHMRLQPTQLAALLTQAVDFNRGYGAPHDIAIELIEPLPVVTVLVDNDRMVQALTNILSNAIKFSAPHSIVRVTAMHTSTLAQISIRDYGSGIPEAFRSRIFTRFTQADSSDQRRVQGSGLGLSIAKSIVEQSSGQISYQSELGTGTTFTIELPIITQDAHASGEVRASSHEQHTVSPPHN